MAAHQLHKRTHPWCGAHQTGKDDRHVSDLTLPYATPRSILRIRCPTGHRLRARNYPAPEAQSLRKSTARRKTTRHWNLGPVTAGPTRQPTSPHHRKRLRPTILPRSEPSLSISPPPLFAPLSLSAREPAATTTAAAVPAARRSARLARPHPSARVRT